MITILTPNGFKEFHGIKESVSNTIRVSLGGSTLDCTPGHLIKVNGKFTTADSLPHEQIGEQFVYDALEVAGGHEYITNGLTSHNCEFMGSSGTLISGAALKTLKVSIPIDSKDGFRQYDRPTRDHTYVVVVDVSRGKGLDFSAFQIIDVSGDVFKQVATYRNNLVTPTDYTSVVYNAAKMYNDAYVLVEINDIGGQVADMLYDDYEYENILHTDNHGRGGKRVSGGFGSSVDRGVRTTKTVKALGCSILKLLVEQKRLHVCDKETISELSVFSKKGTSYEAEPGYHDDTVMCLVLFSWLTADPFFKDITNIDMMRLLRDRTEEEIAADLVPFGLVQDGVEDTVDEPFDSSEKQWWKSAGW